jgi:hypothetical protein
MKVRALVLWNIRDSPAICAQVKDLVLLSVNWNPAEYIPCQEVKDESVSLTIQLPLPIPENFCNVLFQHPVARHLPGFLLIITVLRTIFSSLKINYNYLKRLSLHVLAQNGF